MLVQENSQLVVATPTRGSNFDSVAKCLLSFGRAPERIVSLSESDVGIRILWVYLKQAVESGYRGWKRASSAIEVPDCQLYFRQSAIKILSCLDGNLSLLRPLRVLGFAVFVPVGLGKCSLRLRIIVILFERTLKQDDGGFDILQPLVALQVADPLNVEIVSRENGRAVIR